MITANELRIGNWVQFKDNLYQIDVVSKHFPFLNTDEFGVGVVHYNNMQPIPLTPEVLEKCGLKRHKCGISGADMWQGMDGWSIDNHFFSGWLFRGNGKELKLVGYYNSEIKYIHQLQNLYFALTGEELQYTP